jgi:serine/threonine protein kinase/WD40 repeat protein
MRRCDKCGTQLGTYSPQGLCPRCLLVDGLDEAAQPSALNPQSSAPPRCFGDYELLEKIAHGGMGVVWKARQVSLNRIVAVKMMLAGPWAGPDFVRRFRTETEAAASLQHPNIVAIHEVGEQDGQPFFSMDYVEGRNLAELVRDQPLPARRAAAYLQTIAEAVEYAHRHGVLHRDLKPSNILIDPSDQPRITDFGLAKRFVVPIAGATPLAESQRSDRVEAQPPETATASDVTLSGQVLGSPNYLSPEQAEGRQKEIGPASDVYALGAVLYHLLTGRPPIQAETLTDILKQVAEADPVPLRLLNPSTPRDLETICLKCLEKEIARRYQTAQELADELGRFLRDEPIRARPVGPIGKVYRWCRRRPVRAALIAALVFVGTLGLTGVLWQWRRAEHHARATEQALWQAHFEHGHALRVSGQMGQRVQALAALRNAAALRPSTELRTEAAAAFALPDLEDLGLWHPLPAGTGYVVMDGPGERVAMAVSSNRVEVRQVADGSVLTVFTNRPLVAWPNFSRDGSRLAGYGPERSLVWDIATGCTLFEMPGHTVLALSPNGKQLLRASRQGGVVLCDLDTQQELARLAPALEPENASFSPQGDRVALWCATAIEIWNLTTQRKDAERLLPGGGYGLAWHPDGTALALGCADYLIHIWSWADGRTLQLRGHLRGGVVPVYHPSGDLLASGAFDNTLFLWDPHISAPLLAMRGLAPVGFSADGQWLVVRGPRGLGRLRVHQSAECRLLHAGIAEDQYRTVLDFSSDGRWLAGLNAQDCVVWDLIQGQVVWRQSLSHPRLALFLDPNTLLTATRNEVQQWTNAAPAGPWRPGPPHTLVRHSEPMDYITPSPDRRRFLARLHGSGAIFDLPLAPDLAATRSTASPSELREAPPILLALTEPRVWLRGQPLFGTPVFSPDGQWIASGYWNNLGDFGSALWLWSAQDGQPVRQIPFGSCAPHFSPDGRWFLVAGCSEYRLYAVEGPPAQWREVWREPRPANSCIPGLACFATHRNWLALQADDRIIRLLEVESRRELARLTPLAREPGPLVWSADGRWLAAGSADCGTHLWDLRLIQERLRDLGLDWE